MNTYKRPLLFVILAIVLFFCTSFLAKADNSYRWKSPSMMLTDVSGRTFLDFNRDNISTGDIALSGITVTLVDDATNSNVMTTTTTNGSYIFMAVPLGTYRVRFSTPVGLEFTTKDSGMDNEDSDVDNATSLTDPFVVTATSANVLDAGYRDAGAPLAFIVGKTFLDCAKDGVSTGDATLANTSVQLLNAATNTVLGTTMSNSLGQYYFMDVATGVYKVRFTKPTGLDFTNPNVGSNDMIDSDIVPATGATAADITVNAGDVSIAVDAGFKDTIPPVISASARIVFSMGLSNVINANSINHTVTDNYKAISGIQIKRKSEPDSRFRDTVQLSCKERDSLEVVIKGFDACGLSSCVSTKLLFQDKIPPIYQPGTLADLTVNCPAIKNATYYSNPTFMELCGDYTLDAKIVNDLTDVCGTGTFEIEYVATDKYGNKSTAIRRKITVQNPAPFDPATIVWPADVIYTNNEYNDPSQLPATKTGLPKWTNNGCNLVLMSQDSMVLRVSPTACSFKIIRKWSVANCCVMGMGAGSIKNPWTHTQTVVVMDNLAPKLDNLSPDVTVGCDAGCVRNMLQIVKPTANDCDNKASFPLSAFAVTLAKADGSLLPAGITQENVFNFKNVPVGKYKATIIVRDESNNAAFHTYCVTVKDLTAPKVVTYTRLGAPLGQNGTTMINIASFISEASDNCTPKPNLKYSFSPTKDSTMLMYDCTANRDCTGDYQKVKIYVTDEQGNVQVVDAEVDVQKGSSTCSCLKPVGGAIQTDKGAKLEGAAVTLTQGTTVKITKTSNNGAYLLNIAPNANYTVTPSKNDDVLNGVTTFDLLLINKHILGTQKFTTPYQYLAADIDRSGKVTSADIIHLRKTLLGLVPAFPNNTSWRFIDKNFAFADPQNPLLSSIPDSKKGFLSNQNVDFTAIKVGDVNGNARSSSAQGNSGARGVLPMMIFEAKDVTYLNGTEFKVPVSVKDFADIIAYQFTIKFNNEKLEFLGAEAADNGADCEFGLNHVNDGMITTSWMNLQEIEMAKGATVFYLRFKGKSKGQLNGNLSIGSDLTNAEAYNVDGDIANVSLVIEDATFVKTNTKINLVDDISNSPNPFRESTTIRFTMKAASSATLKIFDQTGRLIVSSTADYDKGANSIEVNDLPTSGLLLYRIETPQGVSDTRRMLHIE